MSSSQAPPSQEDSSPSSDPPVNVSPKSPTAATSPTSTEPQPASPLSSRGRSGTATSLTQATSRIRAASLKLIDTNTPHGMWAATGSAAAKAPSLSAIRRGSFREDGWSPEGQLGWERERERRASIGSSGGAGSARRWLSRSEPGASNTLERTETAPNSAGPFPSVKEEEPRLGVSQENIVQEESREPEYAVVDGKPAGPPNGAPFDYGYTPPPKVPWMTSFMIGLRAFWRWFLTPSGFLITLYGLNVVAWGGMLFLLLCNAAPAMCHPTCEDINSPRRIWLEIDSQILNALFCVTGLGLIPWRFRDLWYLLVWRLGLRGRTEEQRRAGIRKLAGYHREWYRLDGSDQLPLDDQAGSGFEWALPDPVTKAPDVPLTGVRSPPTAGWKMDFVIRSNVWNTFFQFCLCGFMWGLNRYDRPSWSTGLFVVLAMGVAGMGGIMMFVEGKKVKKVEGVPPKVAQVISDVEKAVENGNAQPDVRDGKDAEKLETATPSKAGDRT